MKTALNELPTWFDDVRTRVHDLNAAYVVRQEKNEHKVRQNTLAYIRRAWHKAVHDSGTTDRRIGWFSAADTPFNDHRPASNPLRINKILDMRADYRAKNICNAMFAQSAKTPSSLWLTPELLQ